MLPVPIPNLRFQGYKKVLLDLDFPESKHFIGKDSWCSLNQIHKDNLFQTGWIKSQKIIIRRNWVNTFLGLGMLLHAGFRGKIFRILEFGSGASTSVFVRRLESL